MGQILFQYLSFLYSYQLYEKNNQINYMYITRGGAHFFINGLR